MVYYSGVNTQVLIGQEVTAFGTAATADKTVGGHISNFNTTERNTLERVFSLGKRDAQDIVTKAYEASGSIDYAYQNGRLLAYAIGTSGAPTGTGPYTHTIVIGDELESFTMEVNHESTNDISRIYTGCKISQISLSGGFDEPLKCSADWMAKSVSVSSAAPQTFTPDTENVLAPQYGAVEYPDGTAIGTVQSFELTISNELDYIRRLGARVAQAGIAKQRTLDFRMTINFDETEGIALYKQFLEDAATPFTPTTGEVAGESLVIEFDNGLAGDLQRKITVDLAGARYDELSIPVAVDGIVTADVTAQMTAFDTSAIVILDGQSTAYLA